MKEQAKEALDRCLALKPNDPWTHLYLGNWYFSRKNFLDAIHWFARAARLLPNLSVAFWCLAEAYEEQGETELADKHYQGAVEAEPTDKRARRKLREWRKRSIA